MQSNLLCRKIDEFKIRMLCALNEIASRGPRFMYCGLCDNIYCMLEDYTYTISDNIMHKMFKMWPKFSGNIEYPIPGGRKAYTESYDNKTLWDKSSEYGQLRWELLDFMIETLQTELAQV